MIRRRAFPALVIAGLAMASADAAMADGGTMQRTIPAAFHGRWEMHADNCAGLFSNQSMTIGARRIRMVEIRISVSRVERLSNSQIRVESRVEDGPGNHWGDQTYLVLTDGGQVLHTGDGDGNPVYHRCASDPAAARP